MPLDDRLRTALHDDVADLEPDVERHLAVVRQRSRHRPLALPATALTLAALTTALALVFVVAPGDPTEPSPSMAPAATPAPIHPGDALVGTYRMRLDDPQAADPALLGDWELVFDAESRVTLKAPTSFSASSDAPTAGYAYVVRGDSLSTNLLARQLGHDCTGPGSFHWLETDSRLEFETIEDTCADRKTILTSRDWTRVDD